MTTLLHTWPRHCSNAAMQHCSAVRLTGFHQSLCLLLCLVFLPCRSSKCYAVSVGKLIETIPQTGRLIGMRTSPSWARVVRVRLSSPGWPAPASWRDGAIQICWVASPVVTAPHHRIPHYTRNLLRRISMKTSN